MKIKYGNYKTEYGTGVNILLSADEVATAIDAYLVARGVTIKGPRTICIGRDLCKKARVYVDPSGFVVHQGKTFYGAKD